MILKASKLKSLFLKILKECPYSEKYSTNDLISRNIQIFNVVHPPPFKTEFLNSEHFKFDLTILPPSKTSSSRLQSSNFCLPILFCSNLIFLSVKTLKNSQLNFLLLSFIQASFLSVFVFSWKLCLRRGHFFHFLWKKFFLLIFFLAVASSAAYSYIWLVSCRVFTKSWKCSEHSHGSVILLLLHL